MKIWQGYSTEHSHNMVMIGRFKTTQSARNIEDLISDLREGIADHGDMQIDHFPQSVTDLLKKNNCYMLEPQELYHFFGDVHVSREDDVVRVSTNEREISAYIKLMIHKGARVEVFSGHDYDEDGNQEPRNKEIEDAQVENGISTDNHSAKEE